MSRRRRLTPKDCFEILGVSRVFETEADVANELAIFFLSPAIAALGFEEAAPVPCGNLWEVLQPGDRRHP
jgi:hypothetical protein